MTEQSATLKSPNGNVYEITWEYVPELDRESEDDNPIWWVVDNWRDIAAAAWHCYKERGRGVLVWTMTRRGEIGDPIGYFPCLEELSETMPVIPRQWLEVSQAYNPNKSICLIFACEDMQCFALVTARRGAILPCKAKLGGLDPDIWGEIFPELRR